MPDEKNGKYCLKGTGIVLRDYHNHCGRYSLCSFRLPLGCTQYCLLAVVGVDIVVLPLDSLFSCILLNRVQMFTFHFTPICHFGFASSHMTGKYEVHS